MSVGCAMRTMNQPLACYFRCARRTLPWFIELIRASLEITVINNTHLAEFLRRYVEVQNLYINTLNKRDMHEEAYS